MPSVFSTLKSLSTERLNFGSLAISLFRSIKAPIVWFRSAFTLQFLPIIDVLSCYPGHICLYSHILALIYCQIVLSLSIHLSLSLSCHIPFVHKSSNRLFVSSWPKTNFEYAILKVEPKSYVQRVLGAQSSSPKSFALHHSFSFRILRNICNTWALKVGEEQRLDRQREIDRGLVAL